ARLTPMLAVADVERTIAFYCDQLGFTCVSTFGDPDPVWCHLRCDDVDMMFNRPQPGEMDGLPERAKDFQIFYFYPEDVMALHAAWAAKGLAVSEIRTTVYGMREFELRDPDGIWLWFGQEAPQPVVAED